MSHRCPSSSHSHNLYSLPSHSAYSPGNRYLPSQDGNCSNNVSNASDAVRRTHLLVRTSARAPGAISITLGNPAPRPMTPAALAPAPVVAAAIRRATEVALIITLEELLGSGSGRVVRLDVTDLDIALVELFGGSGSASGDDTATTTTTIGVSSAVANVGRIGTFRDSKDTEVAALSLEDCIVGGNVAIPIWLVIK
jgi:hypothetical protein